LIRIHIPGLHHDKCSVIDIGKCVGADAAAIVGGHALKGLITEFGESWVAISSAGARSCRVGSAGD
jgi:hypothetical protein